MLRFYKTLSILFLCGIISCPMTEARGRNNSNNNEPQRVHQTQQHKSSANQNNHKGKENNKSSNNTWASNQRPGNGGGNPGFQPGNQRPGNGNMGPNPFPIQPNHVNRVIPPFRRPVPPAHYVPYARPMFGNLLGLAIGTALNVSLNALFNNGYTIASYGSNDIHLRNVAQFGMNWPNATLYYNNGMLEASEFIFISPFYNMARYNQTYNLLVNNYGSPIQYQNLSGGGMSANWWGPNGQYITLQFIPQLMSNGAMQYFTTLTLGN